MPVDPVDLYRHISTNCPRVKDIWAAVKTVPPADREQLVVLALSHGLYAMRGQGRRDRRAQHRALLIAETIIAHHLYADGGIPHSPDEII